MSICTEATCSRFHAGANRPLANRSARMSCAGSLPRKWSIRKIASSSTCSWSAPFSTRAVSRSRPNGFSMTIRVRSSVEIPVAASISTIPSIADGGTLRYSSVRERSPSSSRAARTAFARSLPSSASDVTNDTRGANARHASSSRSSAACLASLAWTSSARSPSGACRPDPTIRKSSGRRPARIRR